MAKFYLNKKQMIPICLLVLIIFIVYKINTYSEKYQDPTPSLPMCAPTTTPRTSARDTFEADAHRVSEFDNKKCPWWWYKHHRQFPKCGDMPKGCETYDPSWKDQHGLSHKNNHKNCTRHYDWKLGLRADEVCSECGLVPTTTPQKTARDTFEADAHSVSELDNLDNKICPSWWYKHHRQFPKCGDMPKGCETYDPSWKDQHGLSHKNNHKNCTRHYDWKLGLRADEVCSECGRCENRSFTATQPPTANNTTSNNTTYNTTTSNNTTTTTTTTTIQPRPQLLPPVEQQPPPIIKVGGWICKSKSCESERPSRWKSTEMKVKNISVGGWSLTDGVWNSANGNDISMFKNQKIVNNNTVPPTVFTLNKDVKLKLGTKIISQCSNIPPDSKGQTLILYVKKGDKWELYKNIDSARGVQIWRKTHHFILSQGGDFLLVLTINNNDNPNTNTYAMAKFSVEERVIKMAGWGRNTTGGNTSGMFGDQKWLTGGLDHIIVKKGKEEIVLTGPFFESTISFKEGKHIYYRWSYGAAYKPHGVKQTLSLYIKNNNTWEHEHDYLQFALPSRKKIRSQKLFKINSNMLNKEFLLVLTTTQDRVSQLPHSTYSMATFKPYPCLRTKIWSKTKEECQDDPGWASGR